MSGSQDDRSPPHKRQRRPQDQRHSIPEEAVWDNEEEYNQALLDEPSFDRPAREASADIPSLDRPPRRPRAATRVDNHDQRQARELQEEEWAADKMSVDNQAPARRPYRPRFQSTMQGLRLLSPDSDEEVLDEDTMGRLHQQMKTGKPRQVATAAGSRPAVSGPGSRPLTSADVNPRKLLWWELEQLVPDTVPLARVREWQAVLDRIPSNSPAATGDDTYVSQHQKTAGANLRNRPTLPDYIPAEHPNIAIQAYKLSSKKVEYTDIGQRKPAGSRLAIKSPEMVKLAGALQSRINRYHGAYDIKHRDERPPKAGGKGKHSQFPKADWNDFGVGPTEAGRARVVATPQELQEQRQDALQHEARRLGTQQASTSGSGSQAGTATGARNPPATAAPVVDTPRQVAPVDRNQVHQQLEVTRQDYRSITGEQAPRTNWQLGFDEQYAVLQAALQTWWSANRRDRAGECPLLTQRGRVEPADR
ncbi:MAG: hypothetical protein M1812_000044 [Candelaria pacifica]|nr:MAG: hypothetical protein M1812_000044 [Candelaria pacifica]